MGRRLEARRGGQVLIEFAREARPVQKLIEGVRQGVEGRSQTRGHEFPSALLDGLGDNAGRAGVETIVDDLLMALADPGSRRELTLFGQRLTGERVRSSDLPSRFGFVPEPQSDSTEQDAG